MKVIVTEIDKDILSKMISVFGLDSQISILEETQLPEYCDKNYSIEKPYFIEENIVDLDGLISLCNDVDYGRTPIRRQVDWNEFCGFWELILNVNKLREFGEPITDIEYVYRKGKQLNLPIELKRASVELGFYPDIDYFVIIGESEMGKMLLYQEEGETEFVFYLEYSKGGTHWHPRDYTEAIKDMIAFMKNDRDHFAIYNF